MQSLRGGQEARSGTGSKRRTGSRIWYTVKEADRKQDLVQGLTGGEEEGYVTSPERKGSGSDTRSKRRTGSRIWCYVKEEDRKLDLVQRP